ncbi:hypothetical protein ACHAW5_003327 [Stephanodiscus triporus]|uniref:Uncharacterized protein n=1 Tax=Stephanodiscus triporus TaxID=2934178 RepID=A0ABD3QBW0_9STRA
MGTPSKAKVAIGTMRGVFLLLLTTTLPPAAVVVVLAAPRSSTSSSAGAPPPPSGSSPGAPLRFASPLQSYTVFDREALTSPDLVSPRRRFLPRFRAGLVAERAAREALAEEQRRGVVAPPDDDDVDDGGGGGWAEASAAADERRRKAAEARVEAAHDAAVRAYDERVAAAVGVAPSSSSSSTDGKKFQFVGVVNDGRASGKNEGGAAVTWYARRRPRGSKWNVRLVHVNRDAVLRDLFVGGKVDVYAKYANEGLDAADASSVEDTARPSVKARYAIRERSWRTLWNFSPRRMFVVPSGSFWRERRVTPGLYTDGTTVYESVYRYRDGRNGMKPVAKLGSFLSSPGIGQEEKIRIVERLKGGDEPDLVVEK